MIIPIFVNETDGNSERFCDFPYITELFIWVYCKVQVLAIGRHCLMEERSQITKQQSKSLGIGTMLSAEWILSWGSKDIVQLPFGHVDKAKQTEKWNDPAKRDTQTLFGTCSLWLLVCPKVGWVLSQKLSLSLEDFATLFGQRTFLHLNNNKAWGCSRSAAASHSCNKVQGALATRDCAQDKVNAAS